MQHHLNQLTNQRIEIQWWKQSDWGICKFIGRPNPCPHFHLRPRSGLKGCRHKQSVYPVLSGQQQSPRNGHRTLLLQNPYRTTWRKYRRLRSWRLSRFHLLVRTATGCATGKSHAATPALSEWVISSYRRAGKHPGRKGRKGRNPGQHLTYCRWQ